MHAPIVYGHPGHARGFPYVISGAQFGGSLVNPFGDLGTKTADVIGKLSGWLGPLTYVAVAGFIVAMVRRPRYALLSGLSALATCWFLASYDNADKDRYYLVPLMLAFTWVAVAAAELATFRGWSVLETGAVRIAGSLAGRQSATASTAGTAASPAPDALPEDAWGAHEYRGRSHVSTEEVWRRRAVRAPLLALLLLVPMVGIVPERQFPQSSQHPDGVSQAEDIGSATWLRAVFASPEAGGLPDRSVVVSWWSVSTTLWYGQKVEGLRPDVFVVDDRTRLDQNLGSVTDVIRMYLGSRPVFVDRLAIGPDGIVALNQSSHWPPSLCPMGRQSNRSSAKGKPVSDQDVETSAAVGSGSSPVRVPELSSSFRRTTKKRTSRPWSRKRWRLCRRWPTGSRSSR